MVEQAFAAARTFTAQELESSAAGGAQARLVMTPLLLAKLFLACIFGLAALYLLHTGKKRKDLDRLVWGGIFGLLTALVFGL